MRNSLKPEASRAIFLTGASGYVGRELLPQLSARHAELGPVYALVRRTPLLQKEGLKYIIGDMRQVDFEELFKTHQITHVVHLAGVVNPANEVARDEAFEIDVRCTERLLQASVAAGVRQFIVTSSAAAYGYHADNPMPIEEDAPLRGNEEFAYACHKRLIEEMLARYRVEHPALKQLVLRIASVLGERTDNNITALFDKKALIGVKGTPSPWVFVWDQDVVEYIIRGLAEEHEGVYNVCGDGTLSMSEIAALQGKFLMELNPALISKALRVLKALRLTQHGPEKLSFLRYRPVMSNAKLKAQWFPPQKSTREAFEFYLKHRKR